MLADWQIRRDIKITPWAEQENRPGVISYGVTSYGYDFRLGHKFRVLTNYPPGVIDPKNFDPKMLTEVDLTPPTDHDWDASGTVCRRCRVHKSNPHRDSWLEGCRQQVTPGYLDIPPHSFVLAESLEEVWFPRDVLVLVVGKSTYARCGLIVNVTPGEPEWAGKWTVELTNPTPRYLRVYAGEGIMQCVFSRNDGRYELGLGTVADFLHNYHAKAHHWDEENHDFLRRLVLRHAPGPLLPLEGTCEKSYADKKGKYQNQTGLTIPKVEGNTLSGNVGYDEKTPTPIAEDQTPPAPPLTEFQLQTDRGPMKVAAATETEAVKLAQRGGHVVVSSEEAYVDPDGWAARWLVSNLPDDIKFTCSVCGFRGSKKVNHTRDGKTVCRNAVPNQIVYYDERKLVMNVPPVHQEKTVPQPPASANEPPPTLARKGRWTGPDGAVWVWSDNQDKWVQATEPKK